VFTIKNHQLMQIRTMALYCTVNTERVKSLCGKNAELLLLKLAV